MCIYIYIPYPLWLKASAPDRLRRLLEGAVDMKKTEDMASGASPAVPEVSSDDPKSALSKPSQPSSAAKPTLPKKKPCESNRITRTVPRHQARSRSPRSHAGPCPRLRIRSLCSGEELHPLRDQNWAIPTSVVHMTSFLTIREIFDMVCFTLAWPHEFLRLHSGDNVYEFPRPTSKSTSRAYEIRYLIYLNTSVMTAAGFDSADKPACRQQVDEIVIYYYKWMPTDFQAPEADGFCLCSFGGCCRLCNVPSIGVCWGCGNSAACRSKSCGCDCCCFATTMRIVQPLLRCPILGCSPWWA